MGFTCKMATFSFTKVITLTPFYMIHNKTEVSTIKYCIYVFYKSNFFLIIKKIECAKIIELES